MEHRIVLRPVAQNDNRLLEAVKLGLSHAFQRTVATEPQTGKLQAAFAPKRNQYLAPRVLASLRDVAMRPGDKYLYIVDVDLYSPGLSYVFGEADPGLGVALISLYRLKPEHYGLPGNERVLQKRVVKEAVHEVGHTYYLNHCPEQKCVMYFSGSLADTDRKEAAFCAGCQQRLQEMEAG